MDFPGGALTNIHVTVSNDALGLYPGLTRLQGRIFQYSLENLHGRAPCRGQSP